MFKPIFLFVFLATLVSSDDNISQKATLFQNWLNNLNKSQGQCLPKETKEFYILCDKTKIAKTDLKKLFKMTTNQLIGFIKSRGINLEIYCTQIDPSKQVFKKHCQENKKRPSFKKNPLLQGQFLGPENTILLHSHALKGSLIHEYIHYLQYQNKTLLDGKRYKFERSQIEQKLVREMDQVIEKVQSIEKNTVKKDLAPYLKKMMDLTRVLKKFSFWQDLIDERGIFLLYINFGKNFGANKEDIALAKKNLSFICKREDIGPYLPKDQCKLDLPNEKNYLPAVVEILQEVRDKPNLNLVNNFIKKAPKLKGSLKQKVRIVSDYIFISNKIKPDTNLDSINDKDNILPDITLAKKKAHCVGLSTLFLLVAEARGLQASLVRIPDHVFVKACDKQGCVNVEMLKKGKIVTTDYYFKNLYITPKQVRNTTYLTSLSTGKQLKSSIYLSLGFIANKHKQYELAELFYKKSIDADRTFADAYSNLAGVYGETGNAIQMKSYLNIAERINPAHVPTLINQGIVSWNLKKYEKAYSYLSKAQEITPFNSMIYFTRARFLQEQKKPSKEVKNLLAGLLISKNSCNEYHRLKTLTKKMNTKLSSKDHSSLVYIDQSISKSCLMGK